MDAKGAAERVTRKADGALYGEERLFACLDETTTMKRSRGRSDWRVFDAPLVEEQSCGWYLRAKQEAEVVVMG
jgi:hypothetical protein